MTIIQISNILKLISDAHPDIASFHFGYQSDINRSIPNYADPDAETGKTFPMLVWAAPPEIETDLSKKIDEFQVEIFLYDLLGYGMDANTDNKTFAQKWTELSAIIKEVVHTIKDMDGLAIKNNRMRWFGDAGVHNDRLVCIGATFTVQATYGCAEFQSGVNPLIQSLPNEPIPTNELEFA